jgi:hypothetical protein
MQYTPVDGTCPRIQVYITLSPTPVQFVQMFLTVDIPASDSNRHTLGLHTWTAGQLQSVLCKHKSLCRAADWQRRPIDR